MFHKNAVSFENSNSSASSPNNLRLMPSAPAERPANSATRVSDLLIITSRRCSAFFAEAAVLVLVFGLLDYFMLKGRIELPWIIGALAISLGLLAASIAMDFTAQSWMKAHP
jgi:hypothetical protein